MAPIKLTYFNLRGRAELARLILAQADAQYEDCRIEQEEWPAMKKTLPMEQLPVLEVDGITIGQSITIARFLAKRYGLDGNNEIASAEADQTVDAVVDLMNNFAPIMREKDESKKICHDNSEDRPDLLR